MGVGLAVLISGEASAPRFATRRYGVIADVVECVLVRALIPIQHSHVVISRRAHEIVCGRSDGGVAGVSGTDPYHSVDILLNILDQSLYDVHLPRTTEDESFNRVVDLFLVLANGAHL